MQITDLVLLQNLYQSAVWPVTVLLQKEPADSKLEALQTSIPIHFANVKSEIFFVFIRHTFQNFVTCLKIILVFVECKVNKQGLNLFHFINKSLEILSLREFSLAADNWQSRNSN